MMTHGRFIFVLQERQILCLRSLLEEWIHFVDFNLFYKGDNFCDFAFLHTIIDFSLCTIYISVNVLKLIDFFYYFKFKRQTILPFQHRLDRRLHEGFFY